MSQTVQRALLALELCSERPSTVQDVATELGIHRTTAMRLLQTLEASGIVRKLEGGRYGVGFRLAGLAQRAIDQFDLRAVVHPHLQALSDSTGQTVQLAVPEKDSLIYVDKIEPPGSISLNTTIGGEVVTHTAGVAKSILAYMEPSQRESIIKRASFTAYTDRTILTQDEFRTVLDSVRERGWSYDDGEYEAHSNCIATPIFGWRGEVVGAVSVTSFADQVSVEQLQTYLPLLRDTTERISHSIGAPRSRFERETS